MRKLLITFSGSDYDATTEALTKAQGVDDVFVYDDVWLDAHPFKKLNSWIFEHVPRRCYGYCSWKPLIILDALDHCEPGDVVFYVDADCRPIADLSPIFEIAAHDGACFFAACGHRQPTWCKPECYLAMGDLEVVDVEAGCARFCAFRKGGEIDAFDYGSAVDLEKAKAAGIPVRSLGECRWHIDGWRERQFLYEWLTYSVNRLATTKDTRLPPQPGHAFHEHRDEQAIMTNLVHKYGYKLHRECDQTGEDPTWSNRDRELYPQLFEMVHQTHGNNGAGSRFRRVP